LYDRPKTLTDEEDIHYQSRNREITQLVERSACEKLATSFESLLLGTGLTFENESLKENSE